MYIRNNHKQIVNFEKHLNWVSNYWFKVKVITKPSTNFHKILIIQINNAIYYNWQVLLILYYILNTLKILSKMSKINKIQL